MDEVELARACAASTPCGDEVAIRIKLHHTAVAIAVSHVQFVVRPEGNICRAVEGLICSSCLTLDPQRHQQLAVVAELHNLMVAVVRDPDVVVAVNAQTMLVAEHHLTPKGTHVVPLGIEDDDGIGGVAPLEHEDLIVGISGHC